jgi:hypothetical protein
MLSRTSKRAPTVSVGVSITSFKKALIK